MAMYWIEPVKTGRRGEYTAELKVTERKGNILCFSFKPSVISIKFFGMNRIVVGFNEETNEIGFKPVPNGEGYKLNQKNGGRYTFTFSKKRIPRSIKSSDIVNVYTALLYDAENEYYYIKVGDEAFKRAKARATN